MALWFRARSFLHNLLHRSEMERNMSDELQFHLERRTEDLIARNGLSVEEARRVARLEFGSLEKYKEEARQSLGLRLFDELHGDLRYAFRSFGKSKGFTAARGRHSSIRRRHSDTNNDRRGARVTRQR